MFLLEQQLRPFAIAGWTHPLVHRLIKLKARIKTCHPFSDEFPVKISIP